MATLIESTAGEPFDQATLDADLLRLYGTRDFEHVSYRLLETPTKQILNIQGVEKSWGPNFLRFGLGLSSDFSGNAFFNLQAQYRRTWINSYGGEWYNDVALGRNTAWYSEFYQPLDARQRFFVAPYLDLERRFLDVFVGDTPTSEYSLPTALAGVDFGTQFTRYGEVRLGLFGGVTKPKLNSGSALIDDEQSSTIAGVRLRGYFDQLDSLNFPKDGWAGTFQLVKGMEALGSDIDYDRWEASLVLAKSFGRHTLNLAMRGSGPISEDRAPAYVSTPWGGFLQQSGFQTGQLLNERYIYGRLIYNYRLLTVPLFEGLYAGVSAEVGRLRPAAGRGQSDRHAVFGRGVPRLRQPARADVPGLRDRHGRQQRGVLLSRAALTIGTMMQRPVRKRACGPVGTLRGRQDLVARRRGASVVCTQQKKRGRICMRPRGSCGGRYWVRTSDPCRVKAVLYR